MPVTHTQETATITAISPVKLNPSILEGEKIQSGLYGPGFGSENVLEEPVNITPPVVSGLTSIPALLTCAPGSWSGSPQPAFTYQWYADDVAISGATGSTLLTDITMDGQILTCEVRGENVLGFVVVLSSNSILAEIVQPIYVMDFDIYTILGLSQKNNGTVIDNATYVVTGIAVDNLLTIYGTDIYVSSVAVFDENLPFTNLGAETNDYTDWTIDLGTPLIGTTSPHEGTYYFRTATNPRSSVHQTVAVPVAAEARIDAGHELINRSVWIKSNNTLNASLVYLEFFDVSMVSLGTVFTEQMTPVTARWLNYYEYPKPVPVGTRFVRLHVQGIVVGSVNRDGYVDQISVSLWKDS